MLTIIGQINQDNLIYKCTKLHDYILIENEIICIILIYNLIYSFNYIYRRTGYIFGRSVGRRTRYINIYHFFFFLYLWIHLHNLKNYTNNFSILKKNNKETGVPLLSCQYRY